MDRFAPTILFMVLFILPFIEATGQVRPSGIVTPDDIIFNDVPVKFNLPSTRTDQLIFRDSKGLIGNGTFANGHRVNDDCHVLKPVIFLASLKYKHSVKNILPDYNIRDLADYRNLKPGNNTFLENGLNSDGVWNTGGISTTVVISTPWYRSIIAIFIYLILILLAIFLFIQLRFRKLTLEKQQLETLVQTRTADLEEKKKQIEESDKLKIHYFTQISQEIRTPFSLILGPIERLITNYNDLDNERRIYLMEMISRNAKRLLNLFNQLLDISRLDTGKMKLLLSESDLNKLLRTRASEYYSIGENRRISFRVQIPEEPYITFFDCEKMEKILANLLSNAFKFTPPGGSIKCKVEYEYSNNDGQQPSVILNVEDTGVGIEKEQIGKIFDSFYMVERYNEGKLEGPGIGLTLINHFVRLMHGKFDVNSEPGKGTSFKITLPLGKEHLMENEFIIFERKIGEEIESPEVFKRDYENYSPESETSEKKTHILIVEDNRDLIEFIRNNLEEEYSVYEAFNGNTGLAIALEKIPDLIISDIIMPDMQGIELCSILKNDERTSHIPVILLTAKTALEDKIEGLKSGADDYLIKPFDFTELKVRINNLLQQREKLRYRYGMLSGFETHEHHSETLNETFMRKVADIIIENINDFDFDVGVIQEKIGYSRIHLYRKIKALTGISPVMLIRNYRMKEAARLIAEKSSSLSEVAFRVGYSNPSYFSKIFREFYGVSPKEFNSHFELK